MDSQQDTALVATSRFPLSSEAFHTQMFFHRDELARLAEERGVLPQTEFDVRQLAMKELDALGRRLRLPWRTLATSKTLFNRFYATHNVMDHEFAPLEVAQVCLFLACKIEETTKKLKEIIQESSEQKFDEMEVERRKNKYLVIERHVLDTIGFDFRTFYPHKFVIKFTVELSHGAENYPWESLAKRAWKFANESYKSSVSLMYPAHVIAVACIALSSRCERVPIQHPHDRPWVCRFFCDVVEAIDCERDLVDAFSQVEEFHAYVEQFEEVKAQAVVPWITDVAFAPAQTL